MKRTQPLWTRDVLKLGIARRTGGLAKKIASKSATLARKTARKTATEVAKKAGEYAEQKRKEREAYKRAYQEERIRQIKKRAITKARTQSQLGGIGGLGLKSFDEIMYGTKPQSKKTKKKRRKKKSKKKGKTIVIKI